jgi:DNA modification methylase
MSSNSSSAQDLESLYNFADNLHQPRHRWYPFKEGFSSRIVCKAIEGTYTTKKTLSILDPFGGSGTSALTAALLGHDAVSIEVNPFCAFAAKVKCTTGIWKHATYLRAVDRISRIAKSPRSACPLETRSTFSEGNGNEKWLFTKDVLRSCWAALSSVERLANGYAPALRLAALRAAMHCCHAKKDGKGLRYRSNWKDQHFTRDDFIASFRAAADQMLSDVSLAPIARKCKPRILQADAREALVRLPSNTFDLLVTSPPYMNSFDYTDVYRPELFLGGWVENNQQLRELRLQTLRSHIQVNWPRKRLIKNARIASIVKRITKSSELWDRRIPLMVEAYFDDMLSVLRQSARLLRDGAPAWIVVGSSAYAGVHIPVDSILAELAEDSGFSVTSIRTLRQLRASGQQWAMLGNAQPPLRESLIMLRRELKQERT